MNVEKNVQNIITSIINCPNIEQYFNGQKNTVCHDIIESQKISRKMSFQMPEPFSGEIDKAKILVISSNPSIDLERNESFPDYEWNEDAIIEYFYKRFEKYIINGTKKKNKDGSYTHVRYWSNIKGRIKEIFELLNKEFIPGIDYCLTEIVHCKSTNETGVVKAVSCCDKYFKSILKLSPATLLVVVGKKAQKLFCEQYNFEKYMGQKVSGPECIEERERMVYFIPAPNARGPKKMKYCLTESEITKIKNWALSKF